MHRIVLAYSGGLDSSVAIPWLADAYGAEIVTTTVDLGQGRELEGVRERALSIGAVRAHVIDGREEFARDFVLPALQAGAIYEDRYPLTTALGRPLIAQKLVEIARIEGGTAIAHGCTATANDQLRLEVTVRALEPRLQVIAPACQWQMTRPQRIDYAHAHRIPIAAAAASSYMTDVNLWGRSIAAGALEDPWAEPPEDIYLLTKSPMDSPDTPAYLEVTFEKGVPTQINGVPMSLVELIGSLETIAGVHGVGRIDMVENRVVGAKSREIYEAPAAVVLHAAHTELEKMVIPRDLERLKHDVGRTYADLVYEGLWFTPTREALDAFVNKVQERVTGTVRLKLFRGDCRVVGRRSPHALFDTPVLSEVSSRP